MAYSDLANNQGVSFNSLISGVSQGYFTAKTGIPSSAQMTTRSACNTYVNVDPLYPPFAAKANNQLVVKQDLRANEATLNITNSFFIGTITNVTVNGVSVTGGSFPLDIGNSTTAYSTQVGTYDILVYYADATNPSNYMRITDSAYNNTCVDGFSSLGPGPYYVTFSSQVLVTTVPVNIVSGDGSCVAPPPTLISTLPFSTVAVSRTTGQYMLAGNTNIGNPFTEGTLFRSTNYGANWELVSALGYWNKVAISDNGQYMLAVEYYGRAYKSSDYGANWTAINNFPFPDIPNPACPLPALQTLNFRGAALSSDGQHQVISTAPTNYGTCTIFGSNFNFSYSTVFVSNDYGATWDARQNILNGSYFYFYDAVAISANGQTILLTTNISGQSGSIRRSTNAGVNWSSIASSFAIGFLVDVAILADGSQAIAARYSNDYEPYLISSSDGGATWANVTGGGSNAQKQWQRVAINFNGAADAYALPNTNSLIKDKYRVPFLNTVILNTPLGQKYWKSVANSNNGQYVLLGANNGLFVSNDQGVTYTAILSVG